MTTAIDFTKPARLLKTPLGMYRHDGDRFPGLYLNVGKTKSTWYIKRKVDGKTKSIKIGGFPAMDATTAFKQGDTKTGVANSDIQTVRDGWRFWCDTSQAQGGVRRPPRTYDAPA
jgi:hypothetical protein